MKRHRLVVVIALVALGGAVVAGSQAFAGDGHRKPGMRPRALNPFAQVNFTSGCPFSHTNKDDPIVFPGFAGLSHQHSFVGNNSTDANSTLASLKAATTTCRRQADKAAYWMPTLLDNGTPVQPLAATVYYRRRTVAKVQPFPQGLKMIAGDSKATSPQSLQITYWNCGPVANVPPQSTVPTCPDGQLSNLRLHVRFPSCWDGKNLDSADHKSHMAYATGGACPADHPVSVPSLEVIFRYPIKGDPNVTLSSMGQFSAHADFFNAWDADALQKLVDFCLNGLRHCAAAGPA